MIEEEEVGGLRGCWRARGLHGWLCRVAGTEDTWCGSVASMCSLGAAGMAASTPWLLGSSFRWGVPPLQLFQVEEDAPAPVAAAADQPMADADADKASLVWAGSCGWFAGAWFAPCGPACCDSVVMALVLPPLCNCAAGGRRGCGGRRRARRRGGGQRRGAHGHRRRAGVCHWAVRRRFCCCSALGLGTGSGLWASSSNHAWVGLCRLITSRLPTSSWPPIPLLHPQAKVTKKKVKKHPVTVASHTAALSSEQVRTSLRTEGTVWQGALAADVHGCMASWRTGLHASISWQASLPSPPALTPTPISVPTAPTSSADGQAVRDRGGAGPAGGAGQGPWPGPNTVLRPARAEPPHGHEPV